MSWIQITSSKSDTLKAATALKVAKNAREAGLFLVEGIRGVQELVYAADFEMTTLFASEKLLAAHPEYETKFAELLSGCDVRLCRVADDLFEKICQTEAPQGLVAIGKRRTYTEESFFQKSGIYCLLENLQDPGNVGTILRTADAFGLAGVIATKGCVDVYSDKVVRASMGSLYHLPIWQGLTSKEAADLFKAHGVRLVATSLQASKSAADLGTLDNACICIGNEGNGISAELLGMADESVIIPMKGRAESLNAGIAAGIMFYEITKTK